MKKGIKLQRRDFIKVGVLGTGGMLLQINFSCLDNREERSVEAIPHEINAYLTIDSEGKITIVNPVPEIGQGVKTALPMLVAEELGANWKDIAVVQADADERYGGTNQRAAGSNSVRVFWEPMSKAGAVARELLIRAAAEQWNISKEDCFVKNGKVHSKIGNRALGFGELAERASSLEVDFEVELKSPRDYTVIGTSKPNPDIDDLLRGSAIFGQDVRIPGMLYASMEKCDTYGGMVKSFDASQTLDVAGVTNVFKVPFFGNEQRPFCREGIAVVGNSVWAVLEGRRKLSIEWDLGPNTGEGTEKLHRDCQRLVSQKGDAEVKNDGNVYLAFAQKAANVVEATYHVPFIGHIPMETVNCTIDLKDDSCEVWSTTQLPSGDLNFLSNLLELPKENIVLHVPRIGGGFGRRLGPDFTIEAAKIAQEVRKPLQYFWTREDDIKYDDFRPFSYHRMMATHTDDGKLVSWLHRQAGTSRYAFRPNVEPYRSEFFPNHFPANLVPNFRQEYSLAESNISRALIRAPGNNALAFPVESFVDELAHRTKTDPLQFRLDLLGDTDRVFPFDEEAGSAISTGRMRSVLIKAAEMAGWGKRLPEGRGMGIASYFTFDTYVAHVAEVSVDLGTGELKIHRFTSAVDCGQVLNVDGVKAQVEGAIMDGLSATLYQEVGISGGRTLQSTFNGHGVLRISMAPREIEVHIVESGKPPTGMGEPPYPPVAPALCNAIFAASGIRLRKLPIGNQLKKTAENAKI